MTKLEMVKEYFELSDTATTNLADRQKIVNLFADDVVLESGIGEKVSGIKALKEFFDVFFSRNIKLKHVFVTDEQSEQYKTAWAVAGINKDGQLFSLTGYDKYHFNPEGKIDYITVHVES
ncbi:nuclear transport factor 2 family protein [Convivina praedatoris]|uniref:SnoaL-like domain-containing protein n=1 Tax=Convivina praedatoris TaxID=2880963 RepID=A0ABN8HAH0_9LACO|nr:nuclear transport factor 2 family protein [Convivina sp. LMG 32447]CAH1851814.1 hypothetical protein LMG032447_00413 [Convivina sp. LMG 32447]CAH1851840.1 hypothetical protein R078138_00423 [Convivina sp. LMG 32447]CAH1853035.1 hypothetical protein R077815_00694 [Convivina sp. LMG 32447]